MGGLVDPEGAVVCLIRDVTGSCSPRADPAASLALSSSSRSNSGWLAGVAREEPGREAEDNDRILPTKPLGLIVSVPSFVDSTTVASGVMVDSTARGDLALELGLAPTEKVLILPMIVLVDSAFDSLLCPELDSSCTRPKGDGDIRAGNRADAADFDLLLPRGPAGWTGSSDGT